MHQAVSIINILQTPSDRHLAIRNLTRMNFVSDLRLLVNRDILLFPPTRSARHHAPESLPLTKLVNQHQEKDKSEDRANDDTVNCAFGESRLWVDNWEVIAYRGV